MKKKILIGSSILLITIVAIIISCFNIIKAEVTIGTTDKKNGADNKGTLVQGETDPTTYEYNTNPGTFEATYSQGFGIPGCSGYQIYCINPHSPISFSGMTYDEALAKVYYNSNPNTPKKYTLDCTKDSSTQHADTPNEGEMTRGVFVPQGVYDLPAAAAYIISDEPIGSWDKAKQKAIWHLRDQTIYDEEHGEWIPADDDLIIGDGISSNDDGTPTIYDQEAQDYAAYDAVVREHGLNPTDVTDLEKVKVAVDQVEKELTIGPFNITYNGDVYGNGSNPNGTLAFSGITDIIVIGYNKDRDVVTEDIEIEKFILKDMTTGVEEDAGAPQYFEADPVLKVDETEQVYPRSGQDFRIVIKNPNEGLDSDDENRITYISLKAKFQFMLANGEYTKLKGSRYVIAYNHNEEYNIHDCEDCHHEDYESYITCKEHTESDECTALCHAAYDEYDGTRFTCHHDISDGYVCREHKYSNECSDLCHEIYRNGNWYECHHDGDPDEDDNVDENIYYCKSEHYSTRYCGRYCHGLEGHGCETTAKLVSSQQQWLMSANAIRSLFEEEIRIGIDLPSDEEEPEPDEWVRIKRLLIKINTTMDLGGHVWEETLATKETKADGISSTEGDLPLKNVKVTLYKYNVDVTENLPQLNIQNLQSYIDNGTVELATLQSDINEEGISEAELLHRINPTYTDEEGNYLFQDLDAMYKYFVTFEYNGQTYLPTEYLQANENTQYDSVDAMVNAGLYNTTEWQVTSKASENEADRTALTNRFVEIGSYPNNYKTSEQTYNSTFSQIDLMGYTLDENGKYIHDESRQLVDGFGYDSDGIQTTEFKEGRISKAVRQYIVANRKFPDDAAMLDIYQNIANGDTELLRKIQFILDRKIIATSASPFNGGIIDLYPVYDLFVVSEEVVGVMREYGQYNSEEEGQPSYIVAADEYIGEKTYKKIDPGQYYINLGLWRRQESDISVRKDVYRAAMTINNKQIIYKYEKRDSQDDTNQGVNGQDDNKTYWDINVRMEDYEAYYGPDYNRELYLEDYEYDAASIGHPGENLEVYVTYKITVRNQSMSILNEIKEIADYYDKEYIYRDDLSWIMFRENGRNPSITEDQYKEIIENQNLAGITNANDVKANKDSIYETSRGTAKSDIVTSSDSQYTALYITGLQGRKLASGESAYIYLTFQVDKENGKIKLDDGNNPKENIVELTGYQTYYKDGTVLPNFTKLGKTVGATDNAGLIDRDSNPGNLTSSDLSGYRYEKNFEDDTDMAVGMRFTLYTETRKINGTVWEDERNQKAEGTESTIGDGIRQDNETKIEGVTVQLVERIYNNSQMQEYIWYTTKTNADGYYSFEKYIPGDYVVRFDYGNTYETVLTDDTGNEVNQLIGMTGANGKSYNGQDFKSTIYQVDVDQSDITNPNEEDTNKQYTGYTDIENQNQSKTYGYNIYKVDANTNNVSDAKDIWSNQEILTRLRGGQDFTSILHGRQNEITYSSNGGQEINNYLAEVLMSPYKVPVYNGTPYSKEEMLTLINALMTNTHMTAETGVIAVEFEYDRNASDGERQDRNTQQYISNEGIYIESQGSDNNSVNGTYVLNNIDLGLSERPKAQLEINKTISNLKVTLANGSILFDVKESADNVIWQPNEGYNLDSKKVDYQGTKRYDLSRGDVDNIVAERDNGLIQLTMDEELMHGATIEITYKMGVKNVGEIDYDGKEFYYRGIVGSGKIVTTSADKVIDYVANNLQYDSNIEVNKDGWSIVNADYLLDENHKYVNAKLSDDIKKYNMILQTEDFKEELEPGQKAEKEKMLVLSQLITTENTSDDLTYKNMVEIITTRNSVGRRMAYSVVGNQDPEDNKGAEVDASMAEKVIILPPFGEMHIYYILIGTIALILIGGITLIIKKVLKK